MPLTSRANVPISISESAFCEYNHKQTDQQRFSDLQFEWHPKHLVGEGRAARRRHGRLGGRLHRRSQLVVVPDRDTMVDHQLLWVLKENLWIIKVNKVVPEGE